MKPFLALVAFSVCGMFSMSVAVADDAADVKANTLAALAAYNAGDVNNFVTHFLPEVSGFFFDGSPLTEGFDKKALKALYDAGFKPNLETRQYAVKVYGNTAIVTAYFVGSLTWPGGTMQKGSWRFSETQIKQDGKWKIAHFHLSPLDAAPR